MNKQTGVKYDQDKIRMDLLPVGPLKELAKTYTIGSKKYGDLNYLGGMSWSKIYGAMLRHLVAWIDGEQIDPENEQHHLAAVAWGAFTLMEYEKLFPELDNRPLHKYKEILDEKIPNK